MRILAAEPPGAEKPPTLPPCRQDSVAGDHQRHGVLRHGLAHIARGFRSGAELLRQGAIGRCAAPSDLSSRGVDALKEWILLAEVELEHGKIRLIAFEIAPYSGNRLGHLRRGRAGFCAGQLAQKNSFGRCGALCRQLEARDAHAVPGDPAKAARGFENKIMVCPAHHMALAFSICYGARRTQAGIQPGSCFLIWRAKSLSRGALHVLRPDSDSISLRRTRSGSQSSGRETRRRLHNTTGLTGTWRADGYSCGQFTDYHCVGSIPWVWRFPQRSKPRLQRRRDVLPRARCCSFFPSVSLCDPICWGWHGGPCCRAAFSRCPQN